MIIKFICEKILSFQSRPSLRTGSHKSWNNLSKMAENIPSVSILLKETAILFTLYTLLLQIAVVIILLM